LSYLLNTSVLSALRKWRPDAVADTLIAATAQVHRLTVVTLNGRDFAPTGIPHIDPSSIAD